MATKLDGLRSRCNVTESLLSWVVLTVAIRRAVEGDSRAIYDVHMSAIKRVCALKYTEAEIHGWTSGKHPDGYVHAILANDFFVATRSQRVVGFSEFNPETREIAAVYVHPDVLRSGIGARLFREAEAAARCRGVALVHLSATLNAVPFYEAFRYSIERFGAVQLRSGTPLRCAFMHKKLNDDL